MVINLKFRDCTHSKVQTCGNISMAVIFKEASVQTW